MKKHGLKQRVTVKATISLWVKLTIGVSAAAIIIAVSVFLYQSMGNSKKAVADNLPPVEVNKAIQLNGINQYVEIGSVNLGLTNSLTIMAWIKWDTLPEKGNAYANIFSMNKSTTSDVGQFWLQHNSTNSKFEFALQTTINRTFIQSKTKPMQGVWYHLAATYDGIKMRLYINGIEEASIPKTGQITGYNPLYILDIGQWAVGYRRFKGTIDDVAIYNIALSTAQINEKMNPDLITSADQGLLGAWKFNETVTSIITDLSSYNRTVNNITNAPLVFSTVSQSESSNLPISLYSFKVEANENNALITWVTASELNNDYFTIERSLDGINYEQIFTKKGAGTSHKIETYSEIDKNLANGIYYYRLSQTDFDGSQVYFDPISFKLSTLDKIKIYPNPIKQGESATIIGLNNSNLSIKAFNSNGNLVLNIHSNSSESVNFNTSTFAKGIQLIKIDDGISEKIIKLQVY